MLEKQDLERLAVELQHGFTAHGIEFFRGVKGTRTLVRMLDVIQHGKQQGWDLFLKMTDRIAETATGEGGAFGNWIDIAFFLLPKEDQELVATVVMLSLAKSGGVRRHFWKDAPEVEIIDDELDGELLKITQVKKLAPK